jgi:hypothetical protein
VIKISSVLKLPAESVPRDLRRFGTRWCRLECGNIESLLAFAALHGVPAKFFRSGGFIVPADMRERLIEAGAEPH